MVYEEDKRNMLICCYCLSRLDQMAMTELHYKTYKQAFEEMGRLFHVSPNGIKNRRDDFDPYFPNPRAGWWQRPMPKLSQMVFDELAHWSDEQVLNETKRILNTYMRADVYALNKNSTVEKKAATSGSNDIFQESKGEYKTEHETSIYSACEADFSSDVKRRFGGKCCMLGTKVDVFVEAVRVKDSGLQGTERLDLKNGLCLNLICATAFRNGYITVDDNYLVRVAGTYKKQASTLLDYMVSDCDKRPLLCDSSLYPAKEYLEWHQNTIFLG